MITAEQIIESLKVLGLIVTPFTLWLAYTKIGYNVTVSYSWGPQGPALDGLNNLTIINHKDRTMVMFSLHAVLDDLSINIKEFDPPLILKGFEAVRVDVEPVSRYSIGDEEFQFNPLRDRNVKFDFYIETSLRTVHCKVRGPSNRLRFMLKRNLRGVSAHRYYHNDIVYCDDVLYAVIYIDLDKQEKTAFIYKTGYISWGFRPIMLAPHDMQSELSVQAALQAHEVAPSISPFFVVRVQPVGSR